MAPPETAARSTSAREPAQSAEEHQHDEHEQQQQQQPAQKPEEEHFGAQILASVSSLSLCFCIVPVPCLPMQSLEAHVCT